MDTTTLNVEYLTKLDACDEAIQFVKRNNLEHFPVSRINEIEGDNSGWVRWIKDKLDSVREYDTNGNVIHFKKFDGSEHWREYDSNGNVIHYKNSDGYKCSYRVEYYPSGQLKRYENMVLPDLDNDSPTCYNNKTNGEVKMTNRTSKTTRYAVISRNTGKVLKNAATREVARQWKRDSGKNGLGILDRNSGDVIS